MLLAGATTGGTTADFNGLGFKVAIRVQVAETGDLDRVWHHTKVANAGLSSAQVFVAADTGSSTQPGTILAMGPADSIGAARLATAWGGNLTRPVRVTAGQFIWLGIAPAGEQYDWQGTGPGNYAENNTAAAENAAFGTATNGTVATPIIWAEQSKVYGQEDFGLGQPGFLYRPSPLEPQTWRMPVRKTPYKDAVLLDTPRSFMRLNDYYFVDEVNPGLWGASASPGSPGAPVRGWPNPIASEDGESYHFDSSVAMSYLYSNNLFGSITANFSAEFWYYTDPDISLDQEYTIGRFQEASDIRFSYSQDGFGNKFFNVYNGHSDWFQWGIDLDAGWHHIVVMTNGYDYHLYIDNSDMGSQITFGGPGYFGTDSYWGADGSASLGGSHALDEIAVYDYVLSGSQIDAHWQAAQAEQAPGPPPPQTININRVTETDVARTLILPQLIPVTRATETDVSRALASAKAATFNRVTETDVARALAPSKSRLLVRASETDVARALASAKVRAFNRVTETDTARALTWAKSKLIGRATETDTAGVIVLGLGALNRVIETNTARALASSKVRGVSRVTETDTAQALTELKSRVLSRVSGTDLSRPFTASKVRALVRAVESDAARALIVSKVRGLNRVTETDSAFTITSPGKVNRVTETDTARALVRLKAKAINRVTETDLARLILWTKRRGITRVTETDVARVLVPLKVKAITRVTETDTARVLVKAKSRVLVPVIETDTARQFVRLVLVGRVIEIDEARPLTSVRGTRYMGKPTTGHAVGVRDGHADTGRAGRPRTPPSKGRPTLS